jgi:hypothetical protein
LRVRLVSLVTALLLATVVAVPSSSLTQPVRAASQKVAVIVGPVASMTAGYRQRADAVAAAATAAGAVVTKAYSPNATWANVRSAVAGANVVVYFGHGNGYPNPYSSGTEWTDRVNGFGLNMRAGDGDDDRINVSMVYCGEKAMLGTLASTDGATQRQYCAGGPLTPAPGFAMVFAQAHYAPGFGERYYKDDPLTTLSEAQQRVRNYSTPVFALGGSAFFATAYGDADDIVARLLTDHRSFGDLFRSGTGFNAAALKTMAHPDAAGTEVWVQRTVIPGFHFGDPDYWYAFAGRPGLKMDGTSSLYGGYFSDIWGSPFRDSIVWLATTGITAGCRPDRFCPGSTVTREQMASFLVRALQLPTTSVDYFIDDEASGHEADINRLAASGVTGGCASGRFCPTGQIAREQMAAFLHRALGR